MIFSVEALLIETLEGSEALSVEARGDCVTFVLETRGDNAVSPADARGDNVAFPLDVLEERTTFSLEVTFWFETRWDKTSLSVGLREVSATICSDPREDAGPKEVRDEDFVFSVEVRSNSLELCGDDFILF